MRRIESAIVYAIDNTSPDFNESESTDSDFTNVGYVLDTEEEVSGSKSQRILIPSLLSTVHHNRSIEIR